MPMNRLILSCLLLLVATLTIACDDANDDVVIDGDSDTGSDGDEAVDGDEPTDGDEDVDNRPEGLPDSLEITYTRADEGTPLTDEEITTFTRKVMAFLKNVHYFDYLLYTTHGVDASTGMKDWQFWYNERMRKDGDLVTFYHPENLNDGGHNLHIPFSRALGNTLAAVMLVGDDTMELAATQMCKGFSASMLGMVRDENDPIHHLMSRNVVAFNHEFTTHDGKRKAVDYSGWFSDYERWNCYRFSYDNNPWWGKVWVTSMRSKDDVCHIYRMIPVLRYAVEFAEKENRDDLFAACSETLELLEAFAKDVVDSDYRIRTKDENGEPYMPGFTDDPQLNAEQGDLSSFIHYRDAIPNGECNARRASELIGYHQPIANDCGRGEPNEYDNLAFTFNRYNKRITRYFHLSHVANALVNYDNEAAAQLLDGLEERMILDKAMPEDKMQYSPEDWWRNLALYFTQSYSFGYPLTSEEARLIHYYYSKAVDEMSAWPYWDPWDASVPEGDLGGYRPPSCKDVDGEQQCWWRVEDLAQLFENCWSPLVNDSSARFVDCDIVRDPAEWVSE